jgi:VanZ family protein
MKSFYKYQLPAIAWAIFIFILSSIPGEYFGDEPFDPFDKVVHALLFGILYFFIYRALKFQNRSRFISEFSVALAFLLIVIYGIFDEIHQTFIPGRQPDVTDSLADIIGGGIVALLIHLKNKKREGKYHV